MIVIAIRLLSRTGATITFIPIYKQQSQHRQSLLFNIPGNHVGWKSDIPGNHVVMQIACGVCLCLSIAHVEEDDCISKQCEHLNGPTR